MAYSHGHWNRLGDSCLGCWRTNSWGEAVATPLVTLTLLFHLRCFQVHSARKRIQLLPAKLSQCGCFEQPKKDSQRKSMWKFCVVLVMTSVVALHLAVVSAHVLRIRNWLGLKPCAYTLQHFTKSQQSLIGHDPSRIYVLLHTAGGQHRLAQEEAKRSYAARHGYSFITTYQLFGTSDYKSWLNKTALPSRAETWRSSKHVDHSQVVSMYHVLFEADLVPVPEWVVWIDDDITISNREVSLESLMFGMCARIAKLGTQTNDQEAASWCKYEEAWSARTHHDAMQQIKSGSVSSYVVENTPDFIAVGSGSGEIRKFSSRFIIAKNSDWVRDSLFNVYYNSNTGLSDETTFNAFFNFQSRPDKVKVLPGCTGALSFDDALGPERYQFGDYLRMPGFH